MPDPNFLVIGAQKSGTSWLAQMIGQHPDVLTARRKEVLFFDKRYNYNKGIEWYRKQFPEHQGQKAIGEFTPNYLWTNLNEEEVQENESFPDVPRLVYEAYPTLKLIVTLRDPVQRAISAYHHHIRPGRVSPRSRILEAGRRFGIISMGYYHMHLTEWMRFFPPDRFLILIYEDDIVQNKEQTIARAFRFLDVDDGFVPENINTRYNFRNGHLYLHLRYYTPRLARKLKRTVPALMGLNVPKIRISQEEKETLARLYTDSNQELAQMLGRDLPWQRPNVTPSVEASPTG